MSERKEFAFGAAIFGTVFDGRSRVTMTASLGMQLYRYALTNGSCQPTIATGVEKSRCKKKKDFTSFCQPTRPITCTNCGNHVKCVCVCVNVTGVPAPPDKERLPANKLNVV